MKNEAFGKEGFCPTLEIYHARDCRRAMLAQLANLALRASRILRWSAPRILPGHLERCCRLRKSQPHVTCATKSGLMRLAFEAA